MSVTKNDLVRLEIRIERFQRTSTAGWHPADEREFKNLLPNSRLPENRKLPDPSKFRAGEVSPAQFRQWMQMTLRMDGLIHDNDPRNPKRMMRDMARGKFPFRR